MTNYIIRRALDVLAEHQLRAEPDSGLRRYRMRDASDSDVQRLADVWQQRDALLPELQQLDATQRRTLEQYCGVAEGLLHSRQIAKERDQARHAHEQQAAAERERAAQAEKQAFYVSVRSGFTGTDDEFEAVAKRLWLAHVAEQTRRNMDVTEQFVRQQMAGTGF